MKIGCNNIILECNYFFDDNGEEKGKAPLSYVRMPSITGSSEISWHASRLIATASVTTQTIIFLAKLF